MCGIMASKGRRSVEKVYEGLKKLEYRGYDSCGVACKQGKRISVYKTTGYIENLRKFELEKNDSALSIGHTRWATHGSVTIENSHPHISMSGDFAVVHNGILENFEELKKDELSSYEFKSQTDSEVIPMLIEHYYEGNVWEAFEKAISKIRGSYAIVMINKYDDSLYFARRSSPLIISRSGSEYTIASDINGFKDKKYVYHAPDNCIGFIDDSVYIYDTNAQKTTVPVWKDYSDISASVDKGEYPHYMLKEIMEIPRALRSTYDVISATEINLPRNIENIVIIACGTSYHSSLIGKKYIESISKIPCECIIASEFIYSDYLVKNNTLGIFISQSGETADTLTAIARAKELGIYTLAITNVRGSTITRVSDAVLYINVGAEICVASTKAYTSQVLSLLLLSNILLNVSNGNYAQSSSCDISSRMENDVILVEPSKTIDYLGGIDYKQLFDLDIFKVLRKVDDIALLFKESRDIHLIGKDYDYITSMEGSLKIKEVSYIFTDAYPCGELKHGTLSLIEEGSMVIAILTSDGILLDKSKNAIHEIVSRGGKCVAISQFKKDTLREVVDAIEIPALHKWLMPIVSIIPIDLLAYRLSISKGINPDKPRNLAKSVTVE